MMNKKVRLSLLFVNLLALLVTFLLVLKFLSFTTLLSLINIDSLKRLSLNKSHLATLKKISGLEMHHIMLERFAGGISNVRNVYPATKINVLKIRNVPH